MTEQISHAWAFLLVPAAWLAVGCGGMEPRGKDLLLDAYAAYNTSDHAEAEQKATRFLAEHRRSPQAPEAYLIRGLSRFEQKQYELAELDLQSVLDRTAQRPLRAQAMFALGEIAYRQKELEIARMRFDSCLREIPRGQSPAEQVHWRLGRIHMAMGNFEQADIHYDHILQLFGESPQAQGARQVLGAKAWTVHVGLYESIEAARNQVEKLQGMSLPAFHQAYLHEDALRYAVLVGRFNTLAEAEKMLDKVKPSVPDAYTTIDKAREN
ncbi:MAG: tetratricopeptide repeat protein [Phycisphaerae bacterium]